MMGSWIDVVTDDGTMSAYRVAPPSGRGPGVILLQEIFGVNDAMRLAADEIAAAGFVVIVPDLFWRFRPHIELGYSDADRQEAIQYWRDFNVDQGVRDVCATAAVLRDHDELAGDVGVVGFCLGGKLAVLAASRCNVGSAVAFYGVRLDENLGEIRQITRPLQLHFGGNDSHIPPAMLAQIQGATAHLANVEIHIYPGAQHGFYNALREGVFSPLAASAARSGMIEFLRRTLANAPERKPTQPVRVQ